MMTLQSKSMARKRKSKYKRGEQSRSFQLTDDDLHLLQLVHTFRYVTTSMLVAVTGRAPQKINQRTRLLYDAGYLERIHLPHPRQGGGSRQSIHILDEPGLRLLSELSKIPRKDLGSSPKGNKNPDLILRHKLLISHVQAVVLAAVQRTPWLELDFWQRESDQYKQRVNVGGAELLVMPDAFFVIRDIRQPEGKQRNPFFLEADRDTMDYSDMRRKFAAYFQLWKQHQHDGSPVFHQVKSFRVLTVIEPESDQRLPGLVNVAHEATPQGRGSALFWFATKGQFSFDRPNLLVTPLWQIAKDRRQGLHPLLKPSK